MREATGPGFSVEQAITRPEAQAQPASSRAERIAQEIAESGEGLPGGGRPGRTIPVGFTTTSKKAPVSTAADPGKVAGAVGILREAAGMGRVGMAFSGGGDSMVVLDLAAAAGIEAVLIWADTGMEYPETEGFIQKQAAKYKFPLVTVRPKLEPTEQWRVTGWPMLGKMAARTWNRGNWEAGFKINTSECCRAMKIKPARQMTKNLGCAVQVTGQRGAADDRVRGMRAAADGVIHYQQRDRIWIANPIQDWTEGDVGGYTAERGLAKHPARGRGAKTIGCVFCGGGSQFENSGYRVLRGTWPEAWRRFMVTWGGGRVILALKYRARLDEVDEAIGLLGGLERLARERPWIFDYTRKTPLKGYER